MDPFCDNAAQLLPPFCLSTSELAELRQVERATRFSCDIRGRLVLLLHTDFTCYVVVNPIYVATNAKTVPCIWALVSKRGATQ